MKKKYINWIIIAVLITACIWALRPGGWLNPVPVGALLQHPDRFSANPPIWISGTVSKRVRLGPLWRSFRLCADNGCDCITVKTRRSVLPAEGEKIRVQGKAQEWGFNLLIFIESKEAAESWLNW